jgi:glycosyltransferase involved in cell wall biosynthesis
MRVCLVCVELFAWGKYGGFGRAARMLGSVLARRGIEVFAVVPQRPGQRAEECLDGITVLGFPKHDLAQACRLYRKCNADIYHSQEASMGTWLAMRAMPQKKHLITFRDPRFFPDWITELRYPSRSHLQTLLAWFYESNVLVRRAIRRADRLSVCAPHLAKRIEVHYRPDVPPLLLATPVRVPASVPVKSSEPTVCFLARWDPRKRPESFLELAKEFPRVRFISVGSGQNIGRDASLRRRYGGLPNLEMPGFINQFDSEALATVLGSSWVLINTSVREGLPTSFLEAMAHRCALLSRVNPDSVASRFGYHAKHDDFAVGLAGLLDNDAWRARGEAGYRYVSEGYELGTVVERHIEVYRDLLQD